MKNTLLVLLLIFCASANYAQETSATTDTSAYARVIIVRPHSYNNSARTFNFKIYANDSLVTIMKDNGFYTYECPKGAYLFHVNGAKKRGERLTLESAKTYYLHCESELGMFVANGRLIQTDSAFATGIISRFRMRNLNKDNGPLPRPANRIGISAAVGGGVSDIDIISLTNGNNAAIGFGGGGAIGIKYGHEFSRHFDLSFSWHYATTGLTPVVKDIDITFRRFYFSVTPAFIIPIRGGDYRRLKIGAGFDQYMGASLKWETSKMTDGFDDTWKYSSPLGYHVSINYELDMGKRFSINYGLRWSDVKYDFSSSKVFFPIGGELKNPRGGAIDLLMAVYFHF